MKKIILLRFREAKMMIQNLADVAKKTVRQNTNFDFKILGVYEYSDFYGHNLGTEVRIKL